MDDFARYGRMRSAGASPGEVYLAARADGVDEITCIRMLRQVYDLGLIEVKGVIVQASGEAASLDEHQATLKQGIDRALERAAAEDVDDEDG